MFMGSIREDYIDEMHNLDLKQNWRERCETCEIRDSCFVKHIVEYCSGVIDVTSIFQASSAGRKPQTGAATLSPPSMRNSGSRLPKKQKGSHFDMPSKSESNPSVSPYPPVKYTWEIE